MKPGRLTIFIALIISQIASSQKIIWETGGLDVLKGQTALASSINYEGMQVSDLAENEFIEQQKEELNKKKQGDGDKFADAWNNAKKEKFIKRFNEHFTKASKEKIKAGSEEGAKYLIILTPTSIDLGKGRYYGTKPALVDFELAIVEKENPNNIVAKGRAKEVKGESKAPRGTGWIPGGVGTAIDVSNRVQNFDPTNRVAESFELLAVAMGKALR